MAKYIGKQISVGVGKETVRGTQVVAEAWQPKTDMSFDDKVEYIQDESSIGSIVDSRGAKLVKRWAEGDIGGYVEVNTFGFFMLSLLGQVTSTVAITGAYSHAFSLLESNNMQSLTISTDDPIGGDFTFANSMIDSLTLTVEIGKFAEFKVKFKGKKGVAATNTISFPVDYQLLAHHAIFKTASNLAGLDAASAINIKSFEVTISKNLEDDFILGSIDPNDFNNKQFSIEGSLTATFEATTLKDLSLDNTQRALRFQLIDTTTTIGVSGNPTMTLDLPLVAFTDWNKTMGNNEIVMQTLTFKGVRSQADSSAIAVTVVNTKASY